MIVFARDKPTNPLTHAKCNSDIFLMLAQQTKGQLVMGANVHWCCQLSHTLTSQGKGPRFSSFQFLSTCSLHTFFFCFTPLRHFLTRSVLSISPGCGVRQRKAAVQIPAIEHALKANIKMPATSRVALLFFILFCGMGGFQQSEENKVELQYERTKEPFPHGPLLTQISGYIQLPRILLSIH